jgi:hypothetical protein
MAQITIIFIIKFFYGIYLLIYKKEIFEVRNSPLNRYASIVSKVLYCVKFGCTVSGAGAGFIGGGIAYDSLLEQSGRQKAFLPFMARAFNGVFGEGPINNVSALIERKPEFTEEESSINKKSTAEALKVYYKLTPEEKVEFTRELNAAYELEVQARSRKN